MPSTARAKPPRHSDRPELDDTLDKLRELTAMWPRLGFATAADTAGPSAAPSGGSGGGVGSPSPVDITTQDAVIVIETGVMRVARDVRRQLRIEPPAHELRKLRAQVEANNQRRAVAEASTRRLARLGSTRRLTVDEHVTAVTKVEAFRNAQLAINELHRRIAVIEHARSVEGVLNVLGDWYRQLANHNDPHAGIIRSEVNSWHRQARTALGLVTPSRRIGYSCPYHRDQPSELVTVADEATLAPAILAGTRPRSGGSLRWKRSETVRCPRCGRKWSGVLQLRSLMRVIDHTTLEEFVTQSVATAINDDHLRTTLYVCPKCEGVSSEQAWNEAWDRTTAEVHMLTQRQLDELAELMVCPRCDARVDPEQVPTVTGVAVALP